MFEQQIEEQIQQEEHPEDMDKKFWNHLLTVAYNRGKEFNMEMPGLTKLADEAGVKLEGIPRSTPEPEPRPEPEHLEAK